MTAQRARPPSPSIGAGPSAPPSRHMHSALSPSGGHGTYFHPVLPSGAAGAASKEGARLSSLLCTRVQAAPAPAGWLDAGCANCGRPAYVNGATAACRDGDQLFCSRNCLWSVVVDPAGSRLRAARRKAAGKTATGRRRKREPVRVEDREEEEEERDKENVESFVHAMFNYHQAMGPKLDGGFASYIR